MLAHLVPPPQFATASFATYIPDDSFPSQAEAREVTAGFFATSGGGLFKKATSQPLGLYLDGGFGVGKTHLLAAAWHIAKGRKYFGTFIEYTALVGALGFAEAVMALRGADFIAIDEFELDDPGDTMLVSRLLSELSARGVSIVATSNTHESCRSSIVTSPQIWYPNGADGPAYDLTKITWYAPDSDPLYVNVRFRGLDTAVVRFLKSADSGRSKSCGIPPRFPHWRCPP